ncbi:MAG: bis(5'-nucleosyl)-tetraphosphatase (symmetrical) YqeK [Clostridia bacterium]|nr:bis(5'-nucleosyl)-tetraphosphatase (symmetrical) YqeK [Clostridia bacterium]
MALDKKTRQAYIKRLKPMLSEKRFEHSLNVAAEAVKLAKKCGADVEKAETAGLLHDILKDTPADKQLKIISDFGIIMTDVELSAKRFLHAISGAVYIRTELGIDDPEIFDAVRYHTTGRKNMSLLEKVIFIADFISKDRDYPGVEDMRKAAYKNLDKAIVEGIAFTISDLAKNRDVIVTDSVDAYNDAVWAVKYGK